MPRGPDPSLADRLRAIVGDGNVMTDLADLRAATANALHGEGALPLCLVCPGTTDEVAAVVRLCAESAVPMVPLGGNTGLSGGAEAWPEGASVMIALRRMNRILEVSPQGGTMTVQAGCILADIQAAAERHDRLFPLSLGAEGSCQIGGNIATNAGGINALRYGVARDLVLGLEVVLPDGQILNLNRALRKDNAGYDLKQLFIGSGGTLGIITGAVLRLFPRPSARATAMAALRDAEASLELLSRLSASFRERLNSAELLDATTFDLIRDHAPSITLPYAPGVPWHLLIELADQGEEEELSEALQQVLAAALQEGEIVDATIAQTIGQARNLWAIRHGTAEVARKLGPRFANDVSVPVATQPAFLADLAARLSAWPEARLMVFGHVGDGNLHVLVGFPGLTKVDPALSRLNAETEHAVTQAICAFGGSVTAEHGIGRHYINRLVESRAPAEIAVMQLLRHAIDPLGLMNPGKVLPD